MAGRYAIIGEYEGEGIPLSWFLTTASPDRVTENAIHRD